MLKRNKNSEINCEGESELKKKDKNKIISDLDLKSYSQTLRSQNFNTPLNKN
jgi:hypothetical protein